MTCVDSPSVLSVLSVICVEAIECFFSLSWAFLLNIWVLNVGLSAGSWFIASLLTLLLFSNLLSSLSHLSLRWRGSMDVLVVDSANSQLSLDVRPSCFSPSAPSLAQLVASSAVSCVRPLCTSQLALKEFLLELFWITLFWCTPKVSLSWRWAMKEDSLIGSTGGGGWLGRTTGGGGAGPGGAGGKELGPMGGGGGPGFQLELAQLCWVGDFVPLCGTCGHIFFCKSTYFLLFLTALNR